MIVIPLQVSLHTIWWKHVMQKLQYFFITLWYFILPGAGKCSSNNHWRIRRRRSCSHYLASHFYFGWFALLLCNSVSCGVVSGLQLYYDGYMFPKMSIILYSKCTYFAQVDTSSPRSITNWWESSIKSKKIKAVQAFLYHCGVLHIFHKDNCSNASEGKLLPISLYFKFLHDFNQNLLFFGFR